MQNATKDIQTTVITLYQSVKHVGIKSVLTQQANKIRKDTPMITDSVHELFVKDLDALLQEKTRANHNIIVMGDFNIDTGMNREKLVATMKKYNIINAIQERYGKVPATRIDGSKPLDAMFCSRGIAVVAGGCRPGNLALSDHKVVWADIDERSMIGNKGPIVKPAQQKLQSDHPKLRKRYNQLMEEQLSRHNAQKQSTN